MFSCEYCEIFKKDYFEEHLQTDAGTNVRLRSKDNETDNENSGELVGNNGLSITGKLNIGL